MHLSMTKAALLAGTALAIASAPYIFEREATAADTRYRPNVTANIYGNAAFSANDGTARPLTPSFDATGTAPRRAPRSAPVVAQMNQYNNYPPIDFDPEKLGKPRNTQPVQTPGTSATPAWSQQNATAPSTYPPTQPGTTWPATPGQTATPAPQAPRPAPTYAPQAPAYPPAPGYGQTQPVYPPVQAPAQQPRYQAAPAYTPQYPAAPQPGYAQPNYRQPYQPQPGQMPGYGQYPQWPAQPGYGTPGYGAPGYGAGLWCPGLWRCALWRLEPGLAALPDGALRPATLSGLSRIRPVADDAAGPSGTTGADLSATGTGLPSDAAGAPAGPPGPQHVGRR